MAKPVELPPPPPCPHEFKHMETIRTKEYVGDYMTKWRLVDRFFCCKCMEVKEHKRETVDRDKPEWY